MNTNENIRNPQDDVIELGVASVETQGLAKTGEPNGGGPIGMGITED
ncbi:benenodin family lasso peptide [Dyella sp. KULCS107]